MTRQADLAIFLDHFRPEGHVSLTAIVPDGPTVTKTFNGADCAGTKAWVKQQNEAGRNLYYTLAATAPGTNKKPTKQQLTALTGLHDDLDPRDGFDLDDERQRLEALAAELMGLDTPPSYITDSGNGTQPVWLLAKPRRATAAMVERIEGLNKRLETCLGGKGTANADRLLRLPGTINFPNAKKLKAGRIKCDARLLRATWTRYRLDALEAMVEQLEARPPKHACPVRIRAKPATAGATKPKAN